MLHGLKYRLYPTIEQQHALTKAFGCARYAYNWVIDERSKAYTRTERTPSRFDLNKMMTSHKKDKPWLKETSDWVLKEAITNACNAYENFFKKRAGFPRYKSKRDHTQSASWRRPVLKGKNHVFIPKIGTIRFREHRAINGEIKTITVTRTSSGRYFVSFLVDDGKDAPAKPIHAETSVGIDVGLASFCTLSTGEKIPNPRFSKESERRIKKLQRRLSRQKKWSNRYEATRKRLAREYERVHDQREAFLHELSHRLVDENQVIAVEDLNVKGMLRNHALAGLIQDASWSEFVRMLGYKCEWSGRYLLECGRFDPSSKCCSCCGAVHHDMGLSVREWSCGACGAWHDRDVNAAVNILNFAVASIVERR